MPNTLFLYARKSSESEDRQVLSIDSQIKELQDHAAKLGFSVARVFREAQSAKAPGRPIFAEMMKELSRGHAQGVLCWKLDRLARNPVDGGALIWAMDQGQIKEIVTPSRSFHKSGDDAFWMQLEFGIAKKYVDDLSDNVRRGLKTKAELGDPPASHLPLGYMRDSSTRKVVADPQAFPIIQRLWKEAVRGVYRPSELLNLLNNEWGFRTPVFGVRGGIAISKTALYRLLHTPFYLGVFTHGGKSYQGQYPAMITPEEYAIVQRRLGRADAPRPHVHLDFAYRGILTCGACQRTMTAENKVNRFGTKYIYYHCARTISKHASCREPFISENSFETQFATWLKSLTLPQATYEWLMEHADEGDEGQAIKALQEQREKQLRSLQQQQKNLREMRLLNHLSEDEFWQERQRLSAQEEALKRAIREQEPAGTIEPLTSVLSFAQLAENQFLKGSPQEKRSIVLKTVSHLFVKDRIVRIEAKKAYQQLLVRPSSSAWQAWLNDLRKNLATGSHLD